MFHKHLPKTILPILLFYAVVFLPNLTRAQLDSLQLAVRIEQAFLVAEKTDSILSVTEFELQEVEDELLLDQFYYQASKNHFLRGKRELAKEYANKGLNQFNQSTFPLAKAKYYNILASCITLEGEYETGVHYYTVAARIMEYHGDRYNAALIKNNLANNFFSWHDFQSAEKYALEAYTELKELKDTLYLSGITAILAISEQKNEKLKKSEQHLKEAKLLSEKHTSLLGLIVMHYGYGELYAKKGLTDSSLFHYHQSIKWAEKGQLYHYKMLSMTGLSKMHLDAGQVDSTIFYGESAKSIALQLNNRNILYALNKYLGKAYGELKDFDRAYALLSQAHDFYIDKADEENKKLIQDAMVKYETEKKEAELVKSQLENERKDNLIREKNYGIVILILGLLSISVVALLLRRRYRWRLDHVKSQQQIALLKAIGEGEEKERTRLSHEMHDSLASALTGIKLKTENADFKEEKDKGVLLDRMKELHVEIRRMSHNLKPLKLEKEGFIGALKDYCIENSSEATKIHFINNLNQEIIENQAHGVVLFRICQELIANTLKHAQAKNCYVQISKMDDQVYLQIEDDGIGFEIANQEFGLGLGTIEERVSLLGATFKLESNKGEGTISTIILS